MDSSPPHSLPANVHDARFSTESFSIEEADADGVIGVIGCGFWTPDDTVGISPRCSG